MSLLSNIVIIVACGALAILVALLFVGYPASGDRAKKRGEQ